MLTRLLKEPLLQFAFIASILFTLNAQIWPEQNAHPSKKTVFVSRDDIANYLQNQSGVFDQATINKALQDMSPTKKQTLVDGFFREEALYREALTLGLDKNDPAIRRRMIQSISLMAEQLVAPSQPTLEQLQQYYLENSDNYRIDAAITFTHVFLKPDSSEAKVNQLLAKLNKDEVGFADSARYGDRFIYHNNYTQRTPEFISSHFGAEFSQAVFDNTNQLLQWSAAIKSEHGIHLVFIKERSIARNSSYEEVSGPVRDDYLQSQKEGARESAVLELIKSYDLQLSSDLTELEK